MNDQIKNPHEKDPAEDGAPELKKPGKIAAALGNVLLHISGQAQREAELAKEPPPGYTRYLDALMPIERAQELRQFWEECEGAFDESEIRFGLVKGNNEGKVEFKRPLFYISGRSKLTKIPGGIRFQNIHIVDCQNLTEIGDIRVLFDTLKITNCTHLTALDKKIVSNKKIQIESCHELTSVPAVTCMSIDLKENPELSSLDSGISIHFSLEIDRCPKLKTLPSGFTVQRLSLLGDPIFIPDDAHIDSLNLNSFYTYNLDYDFFKRIEQLVKSGAISRVTNSPIDFDKPFPESREEFLLSAVSHNMMIADHFRRNPARYRAEKNWLQIQEAAYGYFEGEKLHAVREAFSGNGNEAELHAIQEHFADLDERNDIGEKYLNDGEYVVLVWVDQVKKETLELQKNLSGSTSLDLKNAKALAETKKTMLKMVFPEWFVKKLYVKMHGTTDGNVLKFLFEE